MLKKVFFSVVYSTVIKECGRSKQDQCKCPSLLSFWCLLAWLTVDVTSSLSFLLLFSPPHQKFSRDCSLLLYCKRRALYWTVQYVPYTVRTVLRSGNIPTRRGDRSRWGLLCALHIARRRKLGANFSEDNCIVHHCTRVGTRTLAIMCMHYYTTHSTFLQPVVLCLYFSILSIYTYRGEVSDHLRKMQTDVDAPVQ